MVHCSTVLYRKVDSFSSPRRGNTHPNLLRAQLGRQVLPGGHPPLPHPSREPGHHRDPEHHHSDHLQGLQALRAQPGPPGTSQASAGARGQLRQDHQGLHGFTTSPPSPPVKGGGEGGPLGELQILAQAAAPRRFSLDFV
jgi:hypothetical protein